MDLLNLFIRFKLFLLFKYEKNITIQITKQTIRLKLIKLLNFFKKNNPKKIPGKQIKKKKFFKQTSFSKIKKI